MPEKGIRNSRKIPSQDRSRKKVEAIYNAAAEIFVNTGYAETIIDQIAERAGVSIGTLYNYFSGKEAILNGLWERHDKEMRIIIQKVDRDIRRNGLLDRNIIPVLLNLVLELVSYKRLHNRLFISQIGLPETVVKKRRKLGLYTEAKMEAVFRDFANVRIRNQKIGVHILWATIQAVFHDYILSVSSSEIKPEDLIDELGDMMGRYVFADEKKE
ncbi:MAG: TetR/AcrR family transcriptional regulator [Syntrophaceae bacterium]|nr:TetR/AcrR family transcriptional regulator [Syntrophaceae bacterium]